MKTLIRLVDIDDAHAIARIHVAAWQKIYCGFIPDEMLDALSVEKREQKWRDLISKNTQIFVIEKEQQLVGFASTSPTRDADLDPKEYGEITAIYLHPDVWHQGLGKKLCATVFSELEKKGFRKVALWVLEQNAQARQFYESIGFTLDGKTKIENLNACTLGVMPGEKGNFSIREL